MGINIVQDILKYLDLNNIKKGVFKMCNCSSEHRDCICHKICGTIKLIMAGIIIGSVAGMVMMYFFDRDRWLQCKAKKMIKGAEEITKNIGSKITNAVNND